MNILLNWIGFGLAFAAGITAATFCLIQALICLLFALPLTMRLKNDFAFVGRPPTLRYVVAPISLGFLFVFATWAMHTWFSSRMTAYWVGVGWVVIFGLRQCFGTSTNMEEYLRTNESVLLPNVIEEIRSGTYFR